jgi:hypothetical protein
MQKNTMGRCPGCEALLPVVDGVTHRYIGASPACWALFSALHNGGEPPLALDPMNMLLVDAYAVQHPGVPSAQAIQSVAVHLLTLYGVLERGVAVHDLLWLRLRPLRTHGQAKHGRFTWLVPPSFAGTLTVADIVQESTPQARTVLLKRYVAQVWSLWQQSYGETIAGWYARFVAPDQWE